MYQSVQLRWIAEAEARRVGEFAQAQRAAPELRIGVVPTWSGLVWFDRLRKFVPGLARRRQKHG
jgi:hypothetical protein